MPYSFRSPVSWILGFFLSLGGSVAAAEADVPAVRLALAAPQARSVSVAGSFNRWDPGAHPLARTGPAGEWMISLPLPPGRYEYLFIIDGSVWVPDPVALQTDDGLGGRNSVLTVP